MMPAVTARSIALGLFLGVLINLFLLYNDYYLRNTPFIFSQLPVAGMAVLMGCVLANAAARRIRGRPWLSRGEMLLIWAMIGVAGGIGSTGFGRAVTGFAASPAYFATGANEYAKYLLPSLPDWMLVSKDPDSKVLKWYMEGLPRDQHIPWGPWIVPMLAWSAFAVALFAVMFAFTALFYRRWTEQERLTFPIVYLPLEMTAEPRRGRLLNDFLGNPVTWVGAALPIVAHAVNGLKSYVPALPAIPLRWWVGALFPDRPWSEFNLGDSGIYFSITGLSFLMTTEISFSLWFFYVLYRLSFVGVAALGSGAQSGFFGDWYSNVVHLQASGAAFALAAFLVWSIRSGLKEWFRRVLSGGRARDPAEDLLPPRVTFVLLAAGLAGLVGWVVLAGVSWWAGALGIALFVSVILVLTRLVVEAGLLIIGTEAIAYEFLCGVFPASWLSGKTVAVFSQLRGGLMSDLREILMPYMMNGVRAIEAARARLRGVLAVFAVTAAVALLTTSFARIVTCYKYGAVAGDTAYNLGWNEAMHYSATNFQKNPPGYDFVRIGQIRLLPVGVAHAVTGAGVTGGLLVLRALVPWWPLHPIGYVVCGSWALSVTWFSIMLGWLAKACIMNFGGATAYRRVLPFFLGFVLGEAVIATFWAVTAFVTGIPVVSMLPSL